MADISVIACHHAGNLVSYYDRSIFKSLNVTFESVIVTSNPSVLNDIRSRIIDSIDPMPAGKRNLGVTLTNGNYLAFFDDDVVVDKSCLYEMKKYLDEHPDVGMVYCKLLNMEHRDRFDEAGSYLTWTGFLYSRAAQHIKDEGQFDYDTPILAGKSAGCMVRSEVFYEAGRFDESFGILGEETDLSWRIWLKGHRVMFVPTAFAYHAFNTKYKPRDKYYTDTRVYYNGCRNYITLLIKNLGAKNLCRILPVHVLIWTGASFAMILTLRFGAGWKILCGMWYVLRNLVGILRKRYEVQQGRIGSDRDIFPFVVANPPRGYYTQRFWKYITSKLHG